MLLGVTLFANTIGGSRQSLTWLGAQFSWLDDDADEEVVMRYARAYIL